MHAARTTSAFSRWPHACSQPEAHAYAMSRRGRRSCSCPLLQGPGVCRVWRPHRGVQRRLAGRRRLACPGNPGDTHHQAPRATPRVTCPAALSCASERAGTVLARTVRTLREVAMAQLEPVVLAGRVVGGDGHARACVPWVAGGHAAGGGAGQASGRQGAAVAAAARCPPLTKCSTCRCAEMLRCCG